ncbi:MAG: hypothetical protein HYZ36_01560 [Pedosphaera parvula]|nr:hypothetical protein [Pedosphaera parvula]
MPQPPPLSLATPLREVRGIGPERSEQLARLKLQTVGDLLLHRPRRYDDRRQFLPIADLRLGEPATTVLPAPTSPWSSRRMGCAPDMSLRISRSTLVCAVVSLKPSWARNGFINWLLPPQGRARALLWRFRRRVWMAIWRSMNSSRANRCRAISASSSSSGKCSM